MVYYFLASSNACLEYSPGSGDCAHSVRASIESNARGNSTSVKCLETLRAIEKRNIIIFFFFDGTITHQSLVRCGSFHWPPYLRQWLRSSLWGTHTPPFGHLKHNEYTCYQYANIYMYKNAYATVWTPKNIINTPVINMQIYTCTRTHTPPFGHLKFT